MAIADLNQLTISGRVERAPELSEHPECGTVCTFVLTHTVELLDNERFSAEIQFYNAAIYGPLGQSFAAVYEPGQKIIIEGRLDCEHQQTLTGYQPIASILVDSITTMHELAEHSTTSDALPA
jgi:single-stranded DNA-binding protein